MEHLKRFLKERQANNALRRLHTDPSLVDFCSNDYLGFARDPELQQRLKAIDVPSGSTGSRLISGHSAIADDVESYLADFYKTEAALVFNSGYDANIGFWSSVPRRGDTVIYDEYIHASIRDGIRLGNATAWSFSHNDLDDLRSKLERAKGQIYVAVESVYSMDGDEADLEKLVEICASDDVHLIVDEAHAVGLFGEGRGLVEEHGLASKVDARIVTFGKAFGYHGAAVLGSQILKDYLVNFARSFIYTTGSSPATLKGIQITHEYLIQNSEFNIHNSLITSKKIESFQSKLQTSGNTQIIPSRTPIQCILIPGNDRVKKVADHVRSKGFDVRPILHPTVPEGKERLRVVIHTFNSEEEINELCHAINEAI